MGNAVKWGVILAAAVTVFNAIWILAGLHTNVAAGLGFLAVVIILNIVAVIMALKATAAENPYGRQLLAGLVLGAVGGALIFLTSFITLSFVFPNAVSEQIAGYTAAYESMPLPEDQKQEMITALRDVTPLGSASQGGVGTLLTSVVIGAITGAFLRKK